MESSTIRKFLLFLWKYRKEIRDNFTQILKYPIKIKSGPHKIFDDFENARKSIKESIEKSQKVKIVGIKGIDFIGETYSILNARDIKKAKKLEELAIILLDHESQWISKFFMIYKEPKENYEEYVSELAETHEKVNKKYFKLFDIIARKKASPDGKRSLYGRSGIYLHNNEPLFRMIMTDHHAFITNYATEIWESHEKELAAVKSLPVMQYNRCDQSYYYAFKRYFNNLYNNHSRYIDRDNNRCEITKGAGGIVFIRDSRGIKILLLKKKFNDWCLPKGKREKEDNDSSEQNALREIEEETSVPENMLNIISFLDQYLDTKNEPKIYDIYAVECTNPNVELCYNPNDHYGISWHYIDELPSLYYYKQRDIFELFKLRYGVLK